MHFLIEFHISEAAETYRLVIIPLTLNHQCLIPERVTGCIFCDASFCFVRERAARVGEKSK